MCSVKRNCYHTLAPDRIEVAVLRYTPRIYLVLFALLLRPGHQTVTVQGVTNPPAIIKFDSTRVTNFLHMWNHLLDTLLAKLAWGQKYVSIQEENSQRLNTDTNKFY